MPVLGLRVLRRRPVLPARVASAQDPRRGEYAVLDGEEHGVGALEPSEEPARTMSAQRDDAVGQGRGGQSCGLRLAWVGVVARMLLSSGMCSRASRSAR